MEERYGSACILGVLFHEEDILADLVVLKGLGLLFLVVSLKLVDLEEED